MFLKAAREANAKSTNDGMLNYIQVDHRYPNRILLGFDTSYIEIDKNDINAFFECLMLSLR